MTELTKRAEDAEAKAASESQRAGTLDATVVQLEASNRGLLAAVAAANEKLGASSSDAAAEAARLTERIRVVEAEVAAATAEVERLTQVCHLL